jgi:hypothetical protein
MKVGELGSASALTRGIGSGILECSEPPNNKDWPHLASMTRVIADLSLRKERARREAPENGSGTTFL